MEKINLGHWRLEIPLHSPQNMSMFLVDLLASESAAIGIQMSDVSEMRANKSIWILLTSRHCI